MNQDQNPKTKRFKEQKASLRESTRVAKIRPSKYISDIKRQIKLKKKLKSNDMYPGSLVEPKIRIIELRCDHNIKRSKNEKDSHGEQMTTRVARSRPCRNTFGIEGQLLVNRHAEQSIYKKSTGFEQSIYKKSTGFKTEQSIYKKSAGFETEQSIHNNLEEQSRNELKRSFQETMSDGNPTQVRG